ncbi:MAG: hypothetical protein D6814_09965 [Calditrichaeota bacterium]|nr:MAG: hypothetical protein D6814_09965 [Calditrichota bacterium]
MAKDPLQKTKEEYAHLLEKLSSADSPVGIDAQYTHAVIIDYLQQILHRIEKLEQAVADKA